jgi:hypothetical protein
MGGSQAVKRSFVPLFLPPDGEKALFLTFQEGSVHGGTHETATNP